MQETTNKEQIIASRLDIFSVESDRRILSISGICFILAIIVGIWFMVFEIVMIPTDFYDKLAPEISAKVMLAKPDEDQKIKEKKENLKQKKLKKKTLKEQKTASSSSSGVGKGDIKRRVTQKGLLAIISGKKKSSSVASGTYMQKTFAKNLDEILHKVGGLKTSGKGGLGRMGAAGADFNVGYAGGGGTGGIDDLLGNLAGAAESVNLRRRSKIKLETPKWVAGVAMTGARSPASIMRVVMQHHGGLRHAYNKRLKDKPGLAGKIKVQFTIEANGRVVSCKITESTINDKILEDEIVRRVRTWRFEEIEKGDVTVNYPFMFTQ
ncbi:MAG: AgmX/PglI C-terminal domain-containing protein [bacterium]